MMIRRAHCLVVVAAVAAIVGAIQVAEAFQVKVVQAQPGQVQRTYGTFPAVQGFYMLRMPNVQKDLELIPEQVEKLEKIGKQYYDQMRQDWSGMGDLSPEERQKKYQEVRQQQQKRAEEVAKQIKEVLLPQQLKQLEDMNFRSRAPYMLRSPQVMEKLELTEEQKEKLKKAQEDLQEKMRELQKEAFDDALKVLTKEQKKQLREITEQGYQGYQWGGGGAVGQPRNRGS